MLHMPSRFGLPPNLDGAGFSDPKSNKTTVFFSVLFKTLGCLILVLACIVQLPKFNAGVTPTSFDHVLLRLPFTVLILQEHLRGPDLVKSNFSLIHSIHCRRLTYHGTLLAKKYGLLAKSEVLRWLDIGRSFCVFVDRGAVEVHINTPKRKKTKTKQNRKKRTSPINSYLDRTSLIS